MKQESQTWVRVIMKDGPDRRVPAKTFGEAASYIHCPQGHIIRFEFCDPPDRLKAD